MHHPLRLASLALASAAAAQAPCAFSVNAPAFVVACPCGGDSTTHTPRPWLDFVGTARIGTMQRYEITPYQCYLGYGGYIVLGTPPAAPLPVPNGLVVCADTMSPVPQLHIDPVFVSVLASGPGQGLGPCTTFSPYFLFVPNSPQLVGMTVTAQAFEVLGGVSSTPWLPMAASAAIAFTVAP